MFGPNGNPQARNLFEAIGCLQDREGPHLKVQAVRWKAQPQRPGELKSPACRYLATGPLKHGFSSVPKIPPRRRFLTEGHMGILDVTKEQLRQLDGDSLRELVGLMCEAEIQQAGMPVSAVKWGGAHTAADGGLDVEVDLENRQFHGDFVPRNLTGFQVKKSSMTPSGISAEMSPKGQLRPIFRELAERNGCYVIVSLADDPTDSRLTQRLNAMRGQVSPVEVDGNLHLDFYGCGKLSQWLRRHPGVQLWLHDRLGMPLRGWKSFGRWTYVPSDDDDRLISREGISIVLPERDAPRLEIEPGINRMRDLVRTSGKPLRIVGLSGVGKTRIVQALFEPDVGTNPLEHHLAIYADLGETPTPSPRDMHAWLHAQRHRAIIVLDNCPRDSHHSLAESVAQTSDINLISIDLDVRDDRPENSSVIQVHAEGPGIAEVLVRRRHPDIGENNARRIANLSEGNARMALALAAGVRKGESLSAFSDLHLFDRLFYQGDSPDTGLLKAATALSLVYSFSVSDDRDTVDELAVLASLASQNRLTLYGRVQELLNRQLAQKRGHFRAVLPQALADHLARRALDTIPSRRILESLLGMSDTRLLTSFGKRLGYLHDHDAAREIVTSWLGPGGILHEIENLNGTGLRLLTNAVPAAPDAALSALEIRFHKADREQLLRGSMLESHGIAELLCAIAYEPEFFERCFRLLSMAARLDIDDTSQPTGPRARLFGLFSMFVPGTNAGPEIRLPIIRRFLFDSDNGEQELGFGMLEAALLGDRWITLVPPDFGSHPRDYGYQPATAHDCRQWLSPVIETALDAATCGSRNMSNRVRKLLADKLRSLWELPDIREDLVETARTLNDQRPWIEGWKAVREIRHYDYSGGSTEPLRSGFELLTELDDLLRPQDLVSQIRTRVFSGDLDLLTMDDNIGAGDEDKWDESLSRAATRAFGLGLTAAADLHVIDNLSQELFVDLSGQHFEFGRGLAYGCAELQVLWDRLVAQIERSGDAARNYGTLVGVLNVVREKDHTLADAILDGAVQNPVLRRFIVSLQIQVSLNRRAVERLLKSLDLEDTPLHQFVDLARLQPLGTLAETNLAELLEKVLTCPGGASVVIDGLSMRIRLLKKRNGLPLTRRLKSLGLRAVTAWLHEDYRHNNASADLGASTVLKACMVNTHAGKEAEDLCDAFFSCVNSAKGSAIGLANTATTLSERIPLQFLDGAFDSDSNVTSCYILFGRATNGDNPLSRISTAALLDWCRKGDFQGRLLMLAKWIEPLAEQGQAAEPMFSHTAIAIIDATENPSAVLLDFAESAFSMHFTNNQEDIVAKRRVPFEVLSRDGRPQIRSAALASIHRIDERQRQKSEALDELHEEHDQRFE